MQHQLRLTWGVHPVAAREFDSTEGIFHEAERVVINQGYAKKGDRVVIVAGDPKGPAGGTNLLKIHTVSR